MRPIERLRFALALASAASLGAFGGTRASAAEPAEWGEFYIEYSRGASSRTIASLHLAYADNDVIFHNVRFTGKPFAPDHSIIPNAFLRPLLKLEIGNALKAFTEPYYGIRVFYFLRDRPELGFGLDFIHYKVFIEAQDQRVRATGMLGGRAVNGSVRLGDTIGNFNVSHGVNFIGLSVVYRQGFFPEAHAPFGCLEPFVALAAGPNVPHPELWLHGPDGRGLRAEYTYQLGIPNLSVGFTGGARFRFSRLFGTYLEYKFTYTWLEAMSIDAFPGGAIDMQFGVHHLQWGLSLVL